MVGYSSLFLLELGSKHIVTNSQGEDSGVPGFLFDSGVPLILGVPISQLLSSEVLGDQPNLFQVRYQVIIYLESSLLHPSLYCLKDRHCVSTDFRHPVRSSTRPSLTSGPFSFFLGCWLFKKIEQRGG